MHAANVSGRMCRACSQVNSPTLALTPTLTLAIAIVLALLGLAARPAARPPAAPRTDQRPRIGRPDAAWVAQADCSLVRVLQDGDCPIVAFQNFGGDRGERLSQIAKIRETLEQEQREARRNNYSSRKEIDMASNAGPAIAMQDAADRLMELATNKLREQNDEGGRTGVRALRKEMRTPWKGTATLIYPPGSTLGNHTDGCGNWVVLFSFGRTVTFRCGPQTEDLESGDAILFNGGTKFDVVHGISKARVRPSSANPRHIRNQSYACALRCLTAPRSTTWPRVRTRTGRCRRRCGTSQTTA